MPACPPRGSLPHACPLGRPECPSQPAPGVPRPPWGHGTHALLLVSGPGEIPPTTCPSRATSGDTVARVGPAWCGHSLRPCLAAQAGSRLQGAPACPPEPQHPGPASPPDLFFQVKVTANLGLNWTRRPYLEQAPGPLASALVGRPSQRLCVGADRAALSLNPDKEGPHLGWSQRALVPQLRRVLTVPPLPWGPWTSPAGERSRCPLTRGSSAVRHAPFPHRGRDLSSPAWPGVRTPRRL